MNNHLGAALYWKARNIMGSLRRAVRVSTGATAAEYALILALVAVILIGSLTRLGQVLTTRLEDIIDRISGAG